MGPPATLSWFHSASRIRKRKTPPVRQGPRGVSSLTSAERLTGLRLLRRNDRVLRGLRHAELHDLLGRDLDGLAGRRLRPVRALRSTRTSRPMPGSTNTPFFFTSAIAMARQLIQELREPLCC